MTAFCQALTSNVPWAVKVPAPVPRGIERPPEPRRFKRPDHFRPAVAVESKPGHFLAFQAGRTVGQELGVAFRLPWERVAFHS